ncbi:CDK-activating kinase assembly factor MAT1 [Auxenochlorella protothecoides]|uniref:CDK-activating kinase assembly factor MAT1 n=1 Tax=Auxenochlorella protothecoides TaxID=3075 RepID=A0A087SDM2_AUXPR|nr:CDK-activating kinase assembly factor MAT1 [Auxenochlorella protothecoides]KFM23826.1 CDK-activating kinase assembly factor MAT1 [Auxenochlorella protothecoides]RMZ54939.1 hypothetical protein APUTEX25_000456 [Auxenochlorella protothecoides]|eukprot:RMZ54939.1 hypothetical protein APUTEX25_000456 [Auxenochlorella protothecoides]
MDPQLRRALQFRARVEGIFNKREEDFESKQEYDDYLEEREDIIFNLSEGIDVKANEARVEAYRLANADAIAAADARRAEEVRREAALELSRGDPGTGQGAVSGTAAAFEGGRDAEPHQGMDYTATLPAGLLNHEPGQPPPATAAGPLPDMLGMLRDGDISHADARTPMDKAAWQAMASASGWTPEFLRTKCREEAFDSVLVF